MASLAHNLPRPPVSTDQHLASCFSPKECSRICSKLRSVPLQKLHHWMQRCPTPPTSPPWCWSGNAQCSKFIELLYFEPSSTLPRQKLHPVVPHPSLFWPEEYYLLLKNTFLCFQCSSIFTCPISTSLNVHKFSEVSSSSVTWEYSFIELFNSTAEITSITMGSVPLPLPISHSSDCQWQWKLSECSIKVQQLVKSPHEISLALKNPVILRHLKSWLSVHTMEIFWQWM